MKNECNLSEIREYPGKLSESLRLKAKLQVTSNCDYSGLIENKFDSFFPIVQRCPVKIHD